MFSLKKYLLNLNLFKPDPNTEEEEEEQQRRSNIIATRAFLVILISILVIFALVWCLNTRTTTVILKHPTRKQFETLPDDTNCPCSHISLSYGEFTSIQAIFHQVCASDFVSDRWIEALSFEIDNTSFLYDDFRTSASAQFLALQSFCRLSKSSVVQSVALFDLSTLLTPQMLSETVLRSKIEASIEQFQWTAPNTFGHQLQLVRNMLKNNQIISGLKTNNKLVPFTYDPTFSSYTFQMLYYSRDDGVSVCYCAKDLDCVHSAKIVASSGVSDGERTLLTVAGMSVGCLPVNSILVSTLECFYNQTCLKHLLSYYSTKKTFKAMVETEHIYFNQTSIVKSMVDRLMVEDWTKNISYDSYYSRCAPVQCVYSKSERRSLVIVLIKLISLLSGLTLVLGFIIPIVVQFIQRLINPEIGPKISLCKRLIQLKTKIKQKIIELNMFKHHPSNNRSIQYQRYATRLYIVLIVTSLVIFTVYLSLIRVVTRTTVVYPNESEYMQLEQLYPSSLSCPCVSISLSHSVFINVQPIYHQVCTSDFVSSKWSEYIFSTITVNTLKDDFRYGAPYQFDLLAMICEQTRQTIGDALQVFLQTQFVSSQVLPKELLQSKASTLIQDWQSTTINRFLRTMDLVRATTHGNQLMSDLQQSILIYRGVSKPSINLGEYRNCDCALTKSCRSSMQIYEYDPFQGSVYPVYEIPNFFVGCYAIEALLASTLECFYNISCMNNIHQNLFSHNSFNFSVLNASLSQSGETVESIVNEMMVDSWSLNVSFTSYYNSCAPLSCTFEQKRANDILVLTTTIIGVFGGLTLGLKLIILIVLQLIEKSINGLTLGDFRHIIKHLSKCVDEDQMIRRLHFVLVMVTLSVLYFSSAFLPQLITDEVKNPSLSNYKDLISEYPDTIHCSCSQISIRYQTFLTITARFHQICFSDFASDRWIAYLYGDGNLINRFNSSDFQYSAYGQFHILLSLCQLSQQTVNDSLSELITGDLINTDLLSSSLLYEQVQTTINQSQVATLNTFWNILSLIRETTQANMLMSALSTSWVIKPDFHRYNTDRFLKIVPLVYQGCSCALSSRCVQPSRGMMAGCYPLESLLQSSLECFYNQQCIDSTNTFKAMNLSSRFAVNSTIESVVKELMVEEYLSNISYERYFTECAPLSCSYLYSEKINLIEGITTLISMYGGLVIICRVFAVISIKLFRLRARKTNPHITEPVID